MFWEGPREDYREPPCARGALLTRIAPSSGSEVSEKASEKARRLLRRLLRRQDGSELSEASQKASEGGEGRGQEGSRGRAEAPEGGRRARRETISLGSSLGGVGPEGNGVSSSDAPWMLGPSWGPELALGARGNILEENQFLSGPRLLGTALESRAADLKHCVLRIGRRDLYISTALGRTDPGPRGCVYALQAWRGPGPGPRNAGRTGHATSISYTGPTGATGPTYVP